MVCVNRRLQAGKASCAGRGSLELIGLLEAGIRARNIDVKIERSVCLGRCQEGPTIRWAPGGRFILGKSPADVEKLLNELEDICGILSGTNLPINALKS